MKIRQGIDIVSIAYLQKKIHREGSLFLRRVFTPEERRYSESRRMKCEHYSARLAAKRAVLKALGRPPGDKRLLAEIEIQRLSGGKPVVVLSAASRRKLSLPGHFQIELSIAHERHYAIASVVVVLP